MLPIEILQCDSQDSLRNPSVSTQWSAGVRFNSRDNGKHICRQQWTRVTHPHCPNFEHGNRPASCPSPDVRVTSKDQSKNPKTSRRPADELLSPPAPPSPTSVRADGGTASATRRRDRVTPQRVTPIGRVLVSRLDDVG